METQGELFGPISFEDVFGESYFIQPMFIKAENFSGPVEYVKDIEARYDEAIKLIKEAGNKITLSISKPFDLVRLKSLEWKFQAEYRFFLFIVPSIKLSPEGPGAPEFWERFPNYSLQSMLKGISPGINYFDIDVSQHALDNIVGDYRSTLFRGLTDTCQVVD